MELLLLILLISALVFLGECISISSSQAGTSNTNKNIILLDSIKKSDTVYYFGVGSNMLRSKVENRGRNITNADNNKLNGTSITLKSFRPAIVKDYRLGYKLYLITFI